MTPEERAAKLAREICVCSCYAPKAAPANNRGPLKDGSHYANCAAENEERATADIAAAIRDAVKAEREACLRIIEHPNAGLEPPDGGDPTPDEMLANIAADIRERPL